MFISKETKGFIIGAGIVMFIIMGVYGALLGANHYGWHTYYDGWQVKTEYNFYGDDKRWWIARSFRESNGWRKEYYPDGQLKEIAPQKHGENHGLHVEYWKNGILKEKKVYVHGELDGLTEKFNSDGSRKSLIMWEQGEITKSVYLSKERGWYGDVKFFKVEELK
jgi:hypothetical protein